MQNLSDVDTLKIQAVVNYWYPWAEWDRHTSVQPDAQKRWFGGGAEIDSAITAAFKEDLDACGRGERDHWKTDKFGALAFIILCDQYSRNIFRGKGEAFSFDHLSLALAKEIISEDERMTSYMHFERIFIIMPLMHSENLEDQE